MKNDRALCVMCVGSGKYLKQYELVSPQIKAYADKCYADFILIDKPIDPYMKRDIYSQKLLIPDYLRKYAQVAFLDLDILIAQECPSIFDEMPQNCGLMACLNPRGTDKFKKIFAGNERVLKETVMDYFTSRGFAKNDNLVGNINGGVIVFRPALIADMLKDYYYSEHSQGSFSAYEEAPMAYYSQTSGLFKALDNKYNVMINFEVGTDEGISIYNIIHNKIYIFVNKVIKKITKKNNLLIARKIEKLTRLLLSNGSYIIHFAGGYWNPRVYKKCLKNPE